MFQSRVYVALALALGVSAVDRVDLGAAEKYVILAKSGISTVPQSAITGDIAVSPIAATAMTGFGQTMDSTNTFSTSPQVTRRMFAADYSPPTPTLLTTAVGAMEAAYNDAAGRPNPDATRVNFGAGTLGGAFGGEYAPLTAGVYTWFTDVAIDGDIFLDGDAADVFILQIAGSVVAARNVQVILKGEVQAKNIFWQVAEAVDVGPGAHLEGIFLVKTNALFQTSSSLNGRVLAQTAVDLQQATITEPSAERRLLRGGQ